MNSSITFFQNLCAGGRGYSNGSEFIFINIFKLFLRQRTEWSLRHINFLTF